MKLSQIVAAVPALNKLSLSELPLRDAYRLSKLLSAIQPDLDFFNNKRLGILDRLGKKASDGNYEVPPQNMEAFKSEMDELGGIESQAGIAAIKLPLCETKEIRLAANDITLLEPFIEWAEAQQTQERGANNGISGI